MDSTHNPLSNEDDITAIPPALLKRLDPEFRDFVLSQPATSRTPLHILGWSSKLRDMVGSITAGIATPVSVGQVHSINLGQFSVRVLIPEGEPPEKGWPVLLYAHGGGWWFGSDKTGESFYTRACAEIGCVVVSVDYRLSPEHTFPTAHDDVWSTFLWTLGEGAVKYDMNKNCISVCGYSSGANLVASLAQRASMYCPPIPLRAQILLMPILDLTPTHDTTTWSPSMRENAQVFGLRALDIIWSRNMHIPNPEDWVQPKASPLLQQDEKAFKNLPPTWIGVAELDVLRCDGEYYAAKLREQNVPVVLKLYHGATHLTAQADGACQIARSMRNDQIEALKNAFAV